MKKSLTFILLLSTAIIFNKTVEAQSLLNANFEIWETDTLYEYPSDWFINRDPDYAALTTIKDIDAQHEDFSLRLTTVNASNFGFAIFGGIKNDEPIGAPWTQTVDTLRFWLKSDIAQNDMGLVWVQLSNNGNIISSEFYFITQNFSDWTPIKIGFNPTQIQPDTVMIAFASSIPPDFGFSIPQPGSMIKIDNVHFTLGNDTTEYYPPNHSFENWGYATLTDPQAWSSSNYWIAGLDQNVLPTNDAFSGDYAARLENKDIDNFILPGILSYGTGLLNDGGATFTEYHEYISFAYKYMPDGNDTAAFVCMFTKDNMYFGGAFLQLTATSNYEIYNAPLNMMGVPDSIRIDIIAGQNAGSVLYIDDIKFKNNLQLQAEPSNSGFVEDITNSGPYAEGENVLVSAFADTGFEFIYWTNTSGNQLSNQIAYNHTMPAYSDTIIAHFVPDTTDKYELTLLSAPVNAGNLSGDGNYFAGVEILIEAVANENYSFINWTDENENVVSSELSFIFTIPAEDITLTANFTADQYELTLETVPVDGGTVSGEGTYDYNAEVTLTAHPNQGYVFLYWTGINDTILSLDSVYAFLMPAEDITLRAHFDEETGLLKIKYSEFEIFPNPSSKIVNIKSNGEYEYRLLNIFGKQLYSGTIIRGHNKVDISQFSEGLYLIYIYNESGASIFKILKE